MTPPPNSRWLQDKRQNWLILTQQWKGHDDDDPGNFDWTTSQQIAYQGRIFAALETFIMQFLFHSNTHKDLGHL